MLKKLAKMVLIFAHRIVTKKLAKILRLEPPSVIPGCLKGDDEGSLEDCDKERPKTNIYSKSRFLISYKVYKIIVSLHHGHVMYIYVLLYCSTVHYRLTVRILGLL